MKLDDDGLMLAMGVRRLARILGRERKKNDEEDLKKL